MIPKRGNFPIPTALHKAFYLHPCNPKLEKSKPRNFYVQHMRCVIVVKIAQSVAISSISSPFVMRFGFL